MDKYIWKSRVQYYEQEVEKAKKDLEYWEQALKDTNYKDRAFIHRKWIGAKNYYRYTKDYYTLCKKKAAETEKRINKILNEARNIHSMVTEADICQRFEKLEDNIKETVENCKRRIENEFGTKK